MAGAPPILLTVDLPARAYPILIGAGTLLQAGTHLRARTQADRVTIVTDAHVGPLYADVLRNALAGAGFDATHHEIPPGDASKSIDEAARLYNALATARHDRSQPIVALGGGVVSDLAGFVAATWLRGVPFVTCPTTLEADIDAAVGGKTGVNHTTGKNLIGAFHQPLLVCIDTDCLATLEPRDVTAGLAESVKHAVIDGDEFLAWHERHADAVRVRRPDVLPELIRRNCQIKARVVVADERESAEHGVGRAALNLGHTLGHAIEAQSNYRLRHGEAVALGIVAALDLAVTCCGLAADLRTRIETLMQRLGLAINASLPMDADDLIERLPMDKKNRGQAIRFVLPKALGTMIWCENPPRAAREQAIARIQPAARP